MIRHYYSLAGIRKNECDEVGHVSVIRAVDILTPSVQVLSHCDHARSLSSELAHSTDRDACSIQSHRARSRSTS
jgi:hypothetical protein